ncbi:CCA tRNA nucleotidyltransferase [Candidatus Uhrbacteria bacterium]|nr:CCA tRNA nucleotidyltransferase [Candidatus Uhrbacteria bacterium]
MHTFTGMQKLHAHIRLIRRKEAFSFIGKLQRKFKTAQIYLVGGAVRDILIGRHCKDYDFVVRGIPLKKLQSFLAKSGRVDLVGKRFGVLKFIPKGKAAKDFAARSLETFDIALPRTEEPILRTGQYRDFHIIQDPALPIESDLARRDFTINALAYDIGAKKIIDPFGGLVDLRKKRIRTVGEPEERFREDYSRMLRAIRFCCTLRFSIEKNTAEALSRDMHALNRVVSPEAHQGSTRDEDVVRVVPYEVISREMVRAFAANPVGAFDLYDRYHVFDTIVSDLIAMKGCPQPEQWHSEGDVWTHTRLALRALLSKAFRRASISLQKYYPSYDLSVSPLLILAVLFHDIGKPFALKTPERDGVDRVRFDGHDRIGARIAREHLSRLRIRTVPDCAIDPDAVAWLVKNHLLLLNTTVEELRNNTIEKYFFRDAALGHTLLQLVWVDSYASKQKSGTSSLGTYRAFMRRLARFVRFSRAKGSHLPRPVVNGEDVMRILSLPPGQRIGKILLAVREEQLAGVIKTKRDATRFLMKNFHEDYNRA